MKTLSTISSIRTALADVPEPENMRVIITAYWRVLMVASLVVIAFALFSGYGRYQDASSVFDSTTPSSAARAPFSRSSLDASVAAFDARALRYQALSASPLSDADPSK